MVEKEFWAKLLAYNLVRGVMAQAAATHAVEPTELSFTAAVQLLSAFSPAVIVAGSEERQRLWEELLRALASQRVGDRPDRVEPRAVKRRPKSHKLLNEPRAQARTRLK
jgi:hypothetical protein